MLTFFYFVFTLILSFHLRVRLSTFSFTFKYVPLNFLFMSISQPYQRTSDLTLTHVTTLIIRKEYKPNRQCRYCVLWSSVRVTIVAAKKISITFSDRVFVALCSQHAMRLRHDFFFPPPRSVSGSTIFFHIIS